MAVQTFQPTTTLVASGITLTGGATAHAVTADASNATWAQMTGLYSELVMMASSGFVLPAGHTVRRVRIRLRYGATGAVNLAVTQRNVGGQALGGTDYYTGSTEADYTGPWKDVAPDGGAWADWKVTSLRLGFVGTGGATQPRIITVWVDVETNAAPVTTVSGPTGTITDDSSPDGSFSASDAEGDAIVAYEAWVYNAADYGSSSPSGGVSSGRWYSGVVAGSGPTISDIPALPNDNYRLYVRTKDALGNWSNLAYSAYTLAVDGPAIPIITPSPDSITNRVVIGAQGRDNILTLNQSSFETDTTGWNAGYNAVIDRVTSGTVTPFVGGACLRVTRGGTSDNMRATTRYPAGLAPVTTGITISGMCAVRAATTARNCRMDLYFYAADQTTVVGSIAGGWAPDVNTGWTILMVTGTVPAGAVWVGVDVSFGDVAIGASEVHYLDAVSVIPAHINLLNPEPASTELSLSGWAAYNFSDSPPVLSRVLDLTAPHGEYVYKVAIGTNTGYKGMSTTATYGPFVAGQTYTFGAWMKASVANNVQLYVSTANNPTAWKAVTTEWAYHYFTFVPTVTGSANMFFQAVGQNYDLYIDAITIGPGTQSEWAPHTNWTRGGFLTPQRMEIQRSPDAVPYAWEDVDTLPYDLYVTDFSDQSQGIQVFDYEAPRNLPLVYRMRSVVTLGTGLTLVSPWSLIKKVTLPSDGNTWVKDTEDPSRSRVVTDIAVSEHKTVKKPREAGVFEPIDGDNKIQVSGKVRGREWPVKLITQSEADYLALEAIYENQATILYQMPDGKQWYAFIANHEGEEPTIGDTSWFTNWQLIETEPS